MAISSTRFILSLTSSVRRDASQHRLFWKNHPTLKCDDRAASSSFFGKDHPVIQIKRILFPTDFSTNSQNAQAYACEFARHFHAELHLLYILQDLVITAPDANSAFVMPALSIEEARRSAEAALARLPDPAISAGLRVVRTTRSGNPFVEIIRYAREQEIDLIVLGTHGRTGLMHVLLGSVAENVVRKAGCPVLTIRPSDHKFVMP